MKRFLSSGLLASILIFGIINITIADESDYPDAPSHPISEID